MKRPILLLMFILAVCSCGKKNNSKAINIIPKPVEMEVGKGNFLISDKTIISYNKTELKEAAEYLAERLADETGLHLSIQAANSSQSNIVLDYNSPEEISDAYTLNVSSKNIFIEGTNPRSVMLGIQTLRQLIPLEVNTKIIIPEVNIKDYPAWEWRGMMMDISRHFFDKEEVKEFLDLMAYYKFNKFHWHLTDDQGWRIEIKKYPLLIEKSSWREFNNHDKTCLSEAVKEHNTDYLLPEEKTKEQDGKILYGGYYTQQDIKEVVAYAAKLGIDVIPEIDIPGHSSSSIAAYPDLSCFGTTGWGTIFSSPLCPGKDNTLAIYKDIYAELFELFPYEYVHVGADEVEKENWKKCPHCQARIKQENLQNEDELQSWFVRQMESFFTSNGKKLIGWDEITEGGLSENATVMWWRTWAPNTVKTALEQGNKVILTPNSHNYFDYQQTSKTLQELYTFDPVPASVDNTSKNLILGIQANTWAEAIPSRERFQYMTVPRMLALSDVAWRYDADRKWEEFYSRLIAHFPRLDKMKINYRPVEIPDLHEKIVFVGTTLVKWDYPLSDIELRYTTDETIPDKNSPLYTDPFEIDQSTRFNIRMFRPDGSAADILKILYAKEEYRPGHEGLSSNVGLKCEWHEGIFRQCSQIETVPPKQEYIVESIKVPEGVGGKRGLIYSGYINIPKKDIYTFYLASDDGSKLYINEEPVVDNDGPHGPVTLSAQMALDKGLHPIKLYYFDMNNGGFINLKLFGSDGREVILNNESIFH
ncbi:MAG: family 20 glycosylhydrolase [Bacteroidales bacterium]|nr:family 20 glycosylhydrolase [Bacteroidales bacterium]